MFDDDLSCSPPEVCHLLLYNCGLYICLRLKKDTFIAPPEASSSEPSLQFHEALSSPNNLVTYIQQKICPESHSRCQEHAASLLSADSLDIDYDSSSHSLVVSGYWSKSPDENGWTEDIRRDGTGFEKVEVGLLALEKANDPQELSVGGFLGVVGETEKLSA